MRQTTKAHERRLARLEAAQYPRRRYQIFVIMSGDDHDRLIDDSTSTDEFLAIWQKYGVGPLAMTDEIIAIAIEVVDDDGEAAQVVDVSAGPGIDRWPAGRVEHEIFDYRDREPTITAADLPAPGEGGGRPQHWAKPTLRSRFWRPGVGVVIEEGQNVSND